MSDAAIVALVWLAVAAHGAVAAFAWRRPGGAPLVPLLNLVVALCVVAYWAQRWYGYATRGITWYASDQLMPLYAIVVASLAVTGLAGRHSASALHWIAFGIDALMLLAAALVLSFFRTNRLF